MFKRFVSQLAVVVALCGLGAAAASAEPHVIVFGDSLSDNGNLFGATGGASPASPPYVNGRFSNGPVWVEQLFGPMGQPALTNSIAGNVNLAFGGARTDTAINPLNALIPGIPDQIKLFQALGGHFDAVDTVVIWGGANNIFQFLDPTINTTVPVTAASITGNSVSAATANVGSVAAVVKAGAGTVLVPNLPNIGATPSFSGTTAGSQAAFLASTAYNKVQAAGMQALAAAVPGANIIQMDINAAFTAMAANPAAFGFSNVKQSCLNTTTGAVCATPGTYLFWDGVHPTQAGHALLAQFAGLLLDTSGAQTDNAQLGELGLQANALATNSVMDRMQSFITGQYAQRNGLHADILGAVGTQDARTPTLTRSAVDAYDFKFYGVRGGFDRKFGTSLYGVSATILRGDTSSANLKADTTSFQADVYGSWSFGQMFVNADAGGGFMHLANIHRQVGFGNVETTAAANNLSLHGALQAGYIANFGPISIMPTARVRAIRSHLGRINEEAAVLGMNFNDRSTTAVLASARIRAALNAGAVTLFAEVGYEDYLSYNADNITAKLANNTAKASTTLIEDPDAAGLSLTAGINGAISSNVHFDAQYGLALQNGNGQVHSGKLRVKVPF